LLHIHNSSARSNIPRRQDISSWQNINADDYNAKIRKRFLKRKAAVVAYFTTDSSLADLAATYRMPPQLIQKLAARCLLPHEDGKPWGFRALLPGSHAGDTSNGHQAPNEHDETPPLEGADETDEETGHAITSKLPSIHNGARQTGPIPMLPAEETAPINGEEVIDDETTADAEPALDEEDAEELPEHEITNKILLEDADATIVSDDEPSHEEAHDTIPVEEASLDEAPAAIEETPLDTIPAEEHPEAAVSPDEEQADEDATEVLPEKLGDISINADETDQLPSLTLAPTNGTALAPRPAMGIAIPSILKPGSRKKAVPRALIRRDLDGLHTVARQRRLVRHRLERKAQKKDNRGRLSRVLSLSILTAMLLAILIPLGVGLQAYNVYSNVNNIARDGINQLMSVKDLFAAAKDDPMGTLDTEKLQSAKTSFKKAESNFLQLQQIVERQDIQQLVNQVSPDYAKQLNGARHLIRVALDVSRMGMELTDVGIIGANILHGSPLADDQNQAPLISVDNATTISGTLTHTLFYMDDIQKEMGQVKLEDLPISKQQGKQMTDMLEQMPGLRSKLVEMQSQLTPLFWLLGVGKERRFLIQTMDRGELRPGGGFTGLFGVLTVNNGRVSPFSLRDVLLIDYGGNDVAIGRPAPAEYRWMNFGNWGLRDSNLSADYPTTANLNMRVFQEEGGGPVDGNIAFTPAFIAHILEVAGPIEVTDYKETVNAQNLEQRLHYYQQDPAGIAKQKQITGDGSNQARKGFTTLVGKLLMEKVRKLPTAKLMDVIKNATKDLESHDLQVYFTDPTAQRWLSDRGYSGSVDSYTKNDGFMLNQANISISKASSMVHTTEHDDIVLDANGGALHTLTVTLTYKQTGNVYGFDTYADYMRIYAPQNAQYRWGHGFDSGQSLCTATTKPADPKPPTKPGDPKPPDPKPEEQGCSKYKTSFPDDARYCPSGNYDLGNRGMNTPWPYDKLGGPTSSNSDLGGHMMWGGLTVTPKNCISDITISWYVPKAVKFDAQGKPSYQVFVQKQGGYTPTIELNVDASALKGGKTFQIKEDIVKDTLFTMPS
jgi:hypothetical protein